MTKILKDWFTALGNEHYKAGRTARQFCTWLKRKMSVRP
jgi:hypothetical protein